MQRIELLYRMCQCQEVNEFAVISSDYKLHSLLHARGYPDTLVDKTLSEVKFEERKSALQQKKRTNLKILPFVTQYHPAVPNLKKVLMSKWHLIQNQPLLSEIYKEPPIISYKRGKSLKDILVRSKL